MFFENLVNYYFLIGLLVGATSKVFGGQIVSLTAGLAVGVLMCELLRISVWYFSK